MKDYKKFPSSQFIIRWATVVVVVGAMTCLSFYVINQYNRQNELFTVHLQEMVQYASLPFKLAQLEKQEVSTELLVPVYGVQLSQIVDTWGTARSAGRTHEGTDIFADSGTPVFSMTNGYVTRIGFGELGGNYVFVTGPGGVRYYYAHLYRLPIGLKVGSFVTTDTVLGFVGQTGNAETTPPHLHLGVYKRPGGAQNPYPLLVDREW